LVVSIFLGDALCPENGIWGWYLSHDLPYSNVTLF
jgi:hypothetical protein